MKHLFWIYIIAFSCKNEKNNSFVSGNKSDTIEISKSKELENPFPFEPIDFLDTKMSKIGMPDYSYYYPHKKTITPICVVDTTSTAFMLINGRLEQFTRVHQEGTTTAEQYQNERYNIREEFDDPIQSVTLVITDRKKHTIYRIDCRREGPLTFSYDE